MPNITWCDLPTDVSLWPGLPLSLSGDEVMPLDYHAGRSGWLLYGRGLDKQRLTQYQTKLGPRWSSSPPGAWKTTRSFAWRAL